MNPGQASDTFGRMQAWRGVSWISGFLCALVVKKLLRASYRAVRKDTDPATAFDPTKAGFSWSDALLWGAAAGIGLVMARIVGDRLAALGWQAATHSPAPGVEEPAAV